MKSINWRFIIKTGAILGLLGLVGASGFSETSPGPGTQAAATPKVPVSSPAPVSLVATRIPGSQYNNFIKNWDESKHPRAFALLGSLDQYKLVFHGAPLMWTKKPTLPEASLFTTEMVVVTSRVSTGKPGLDEVYVLGPVTVQNGILTVEYSYKAEPPASSSQAMFKCMLELRIPRGDYQTVRFVENGTEVGRLALDQGQFMLPEFSAD